MGCRLDEYFCTTKLSGLLVRHCALQNRNLSKVLLCRLHALSNGCSYFASLTKAIADNTIFITNNHYRRKTKGSTTLGYLSNTINGNQSVFKLSLA